MSGDARWDDLAPRVISAVLMLFVGGLELWLGGQTFFALCMVIGAGMVWELSRMIAPDQKSLSLGLAFLAFLSLPHADIVPRAIAPLLFLIPAIVGVVFLPREKLRFAFFAVAVLWAVFALTQLREVYGLIWVLWLFLVVIATDVAGYFAGKTFGGPKFWPAISPKKTWSGTAGGWVAAAVVGIVFASFTEANFLLAVLSVAMSFASQMGDIAESAFKRRMGVKDSSDLIPGHGGLFDRFDGFLGAVLFLFILGYFITLPQVMI
ncbi:MAG: phosphatidate cytidylyltransferase [Pseudoruegeria sp.]